MVNIKNYKQFSINEDYPIKPIDYQKLNRIVYDLLRHINDIIDKSGLDNSEEYLVLTYLSGKIQGDNRVKAQTEGLDRDKIMKIFSKVVSDRDIDFLISLNLSTEQYQQLSEVMSDDGDDDFLQALI